MKTEQEFLCEVIKRGNQKKAKRRAYISALTVCVCIAITAIAIPIINNQNAEPQKYQISGDVCIDFYKKADLMCNVKEITETVIFDNSSTANSASKSENDEVTIDNNTAEYNFQTQDMTGIYTVTDSGFEVAIINSRGEQKLYTLEKNVMNTNLGTVTELTDEQITELKNILEDK